MNLTALAHETILRHRPQFDTALDATVGNGKDALFLAAHAKQLYCFDVQAEAITKAKQTLQEAPAHCHIDWVHSSHVYIKDHVQAPIDVCMFNLGYLPGGDHSHTTTSASTIQALAVAMSLLAGGGVLSIICYPGHSEGKVEHEAVKKWLQHDHRPLVFSSTPKKPTAPVLYILQRPNPHIA